jgi:large subunit ribosomal protein L18
MIMANYKQTKLRQKHRLRRKQRVRKKISGTAVKPRLSLFRSPKHLYAQVIDDATGNTLVAVSSFEKGKHGSANVEASGELGKILAQRCQAKQITTIVFDKNGSQYHGRVKAFADGARAGGLKF